MEREREREREKESLKGRERLWERKKESEREPEREREREGGGGRKKEREREICTASRLTATNTCYHPAITLLTFMNTLSFLLDWPYGFVKINRFIR